MSRYRRARTLFCRVKWLGMPPGVEPGLPALLKAGVLPLHYSSHDPPKEVRPRPT